MSEQTKEELQRFTTLVNPTILSHIKLISYFTNQKLYEVINSSLEEHISKFEIKNKTCTLISELELLYMRSYKKPLFLIKFIFLLKGNRKRFLGLQSLDQCPSKTLTFLTKWIENRLN